MLVRLYNRIYNESFLTDSQMRSMITMNNMKSISDWISSTRNSEVDQYPLFAKDISFDDLYVTKSDFSKLMQTASNMQISDGYARLLSHYLTRNDVTYKGIFCYESDWGILNPRFYYECTRLFKNLSGKYPGFYTVTIEDTGDTVRMLSNYYESVSLPKYFLKFVGPKVSERNVEITNDQDSVLKKVGSIIQTLKSDVIKALSLSSSVDVDSYIERAIDQLDDSIKSETIRRDLLALNLSNLKKIQSELRSYVNSLSKFTGFYTKAIKSFVLSLDVPIAEYVDKFLSGDTGFEYIDDKNLLFRLETDKKKVVKDFLEYDFEARIGFFNRRIENMSDRIEEYRSDLRILNEIDQYEEDFTKGLNSVYRSVVLHPWDSNGKVFNMTNFRNSRVSAFALNMRYTNDAHRVVGLMLTVPQGQNIVAWVLNAAGEAKNNFVIGSSGSLEVK